MNIIKMSAIKLAKASLRKEIESKLGLLSKEERVRQSEIIRNSLFGLDEFKSAKNISVFLSLETEIDTEPIVKRIFDNGKKCFVPRYKKGAMEMVELHSMEDWASLPVTKWNIKQPSFKDERKNALEEGLDLVIVPGVAFTKEGLRLGHGAGYYDKYLKLLKEHQEVPPKTIAVGFKEQMVDNLPTEETDVTIDMILYPSN